MTVRTDAKRCRRRWSGPTERLEPRHMLAGFVDEGVALERIAFQLGAFGEASRASFGDVDGDGKLDLLRNNEVHFGDGTGGFNTVTNVGRSGRLVDMDGDGDLDLLTGYSGSSWLLENRGRVNGMWAGFAPDIRLANTSQFILAVADLNADGHQDLVIGFDNARFQVLIGTGRFEFARPVNYSTGSGSVGKILVDDLDADGDLDLVAVPSYTPSGSVFILTNDGTGSFDPSEYQVGGEHTLSDFGVGDVDRDGDLDVIVSSVRERDQNILVMKQQANHGFTRDSLAYSLRGFVESITLADVNSDGILDLLAIHPWRNLHELSAVGVSLMVGKSDGGFRQPVLFEQGEMSVALVADLDGKGHPEIAVFGRYSGHSMWRVAEVPFLPARVTVKEPAVEPASEIVVVGDWDGDGRDERAFRTSRGWELRFEQEKRPPMTLPLPGQGVRLFRAQDYNGDGLPDLLVSTAEQVVVFHQMQDGMLGAPIATSIDGYYYFESDHVLDLNGDGYLDLLVRQDPATRALFGSVDGEFRESFQVNGSLLPLGDVTGDNVPELVVFQNGRPSAIARYVEAAGLVTLMELADNWFPGVIADVSGDGIAELVRTTQDAYVLMRQAESGEFTAFAEIPRQSDYLTTLDDVTGDGIRELAEVGATQSRLWSLTGDGSLVAVMSFAGVLFTVDDITSDGQRELVSMAGDGTRLWRMTPDGTFIVATEFPGNTQLQPAGDLDGDGLIDLLSVPRSPQANETTVWLNRGNAVFEKWASLAALVAPTLIRTVDLNRDGHLDLVVVSQSVVPSWRWGLFDGPYGALAIEVLTGTAQQTLTRSVNFSFAWPFQVDSVRIEDADADSDLDLVLLGRSLSNNDELLVERQVVLHNLTDLPSLAGDIDGNGWLDVADLDELCRVVRQHETPRPVHDVDTDGTVDARDVDFLLSQYFGTGPGDANLDQVFDSSDLVLVFQLGEYEDGIEGNSTWSDGDWNCDGEFNTTDLVVAFQQGLYR